MITLIFKLLRGPKGHRVQSNEVHSGWVSIKAEVPQGSNVRPLFFLAYIGDIFFGLPSSVRQFAGDTWWLKNQPDKDSLKIRLGTNKCEMSFDPNLTWGYCFWKPPNKADAPHGAHPPPPSLKNEPPSQLKPPTPPPPTPPLLKSKAPCALRLVENFVSECLNFNYK